MSFMDNIASAVAEAAELTDMNEARKVGTGEARLAVAGAPRLRLISYIEMGTHEDEWQGQKRKAKKVCLQFELSGPKYPTLDLEDGRKLPFIITINEKISLTEKSGFYKLFKRMNHTGQYKIMAQMLGQEFLGTVVHKASATDATKIYANLRDEGGYTIRPPYFEDPETGESRRIEVAPALTPLKCFLWDNPNKEMWDSIFIDGTWDDKKDKEGNVIEVGKSRNYYQNMIRSALDFEGSPISTIVAGADPLELGDAERPERDEGAVQASIDKKAGAASDPLEDIG